jgi:hypothetical protein
MNQFIRCLRNLVVFALVAWAGVDDYFPLPGSMADPGTETGECSLFDGAACRKSSAAVDHSSAAARSLSTQAPLASSDARCGRLSASHLRTHSDIDGVYALMSLRC